MDSDSSSHLPQGFKLGKGAFGNVYHQNGNAVKQFDNLRYLIQEYAALKYLSNCNYVVHAMDVNFLKLQLEMDLYDCNLRKWIFLNLYKASIDKEIMKSCNIIIHDVLRGLVELHDRGLAHGDLKPGNILIRNSPTKAVLGDCGFVSVYKYVKVNQTTEVYRDPIVDRAQSHDMFSLGICLFELVSGIRIMKRKSYNQLARMIKKKITDEKYYKIISSLLSEDKDKRYTSREVLEILYNETPEYWKKHIINVIDPFNNKSRLEDDTVFYDNIDKENCKYIRDIIQVIGHNYRINRRGKGYGAILFYLNKNKINYKFYAVYSIITLLILSSLFGKSSFQESDCLSLCRECKELSSVTFYDIIHELLSNNDYINIILST